MKIAYFSPFPPEKSGIADFSMELVFALKKTITVDIYTGNDALKNKELTNSFTVFPYRHIEKVDLDTYDTLVYHMGNNQIFHEEIFYYFMKYPGILEIHDFSVHDFFAGLLLEKLENPKLYKELLTYCNGSKGKYAARKFSNREIAPLWVTSPNEFPLNKLMIDNATGVIVHSEYAKQKVLETRSDFPVITIPLHTDIIVDDFIQNKNNAKEQLFIPRKLFVLGSFGLASSSKRIPEILEALFHLKQRGYNFLYLIVGECADSEIFKKIKEYGLENDVCITGFVSLQDFTLYMSACDVCMNLRFPTQGESSASLHRMLGLGKAAFVSQVGSFTEYPDDIVIPISVGENEVTEIVNNLDKILKSPDILYSMGEKAIEFAKENCDIDKNAQKYIEFFQYNSFFSSRPESYLSYPEYFSKFLLDANVEDPDYIHHLSQKFNNWV